MRVFNPPRLDSPVGWLTRDHRKSIAVDGARRIRQRAVRERDGGSAIRPAGSRPGAIPAWRFAGRQWPRSSAHSATSGPRVAAARSRTTNSHRLIRSRPAGRRFACGSSPRVPESGGLFRLDHLIAAAASGRLWLTDAYFVGLTPYVQALCSAARDDVDVRLLVPGASDLPVVSQISRTGYRQLLENGVRVFEWNGSMLHAKTRRRR